MDKLFQQASDSLKEKFKALESRVRELEAERDRLKEENGNMDSMYQDRMLDLEAKLHKHYERVDACTTQCIRNEKLLIERIRVSDEHFAESVEMYMGMINKLEIGGARMRFDGKPETHYHLVCTSCGRIHDLPADSVPAVGKALARARIGDFQITASRVELLGLCRGCRGRKRPRAPRAMKGSR